jgi:nitrate/TMAO reductase-like tetraheme cytochrome c subunit
MKRFKSIHWLSILGLIFGVNSALLIIILYIIASVFLESSTYIGIYIYMILPLLLIFSILLFIIGSLFNIRRKRKIAPEDQKLPILDLNNKKHRRRLVIISLGTFIFIIVSAVGNYQAFHYTESVEFCGKLCHQVMEPEYTTYLNSPHARVKCVECHVGEGADWYVKSKISGLYQVYAVLFNKFPQPIPTPIESLRPARETCEKCHWPQKFYATKVRNQVSYLSDSLNPEWHISLLMKIGPSNSDFGLKEGIHWHINQDVKIEYVSTSKDREEIPWVKYTNLKTGEFKIFQDTTVVLSKKTLDSLKVRTMDCIDCHNRPSHSYKSAPVFVNSLMLLNEVSPKVPFIKKAAMESLKNPFPTVEVAMRSIKDSILNFYKNNHPEIYQKYPNEINSAISSIQKGYKMNNFPFMKASSSDYPNHIGHLETKGCFRCHSNTHISSKGEKITRDCNLCHTIIGQGPANNTKYVSLQDSLEFIHPKDIEDAWKEYFCSECHNVLYP